MLATLDVANRVCPKNPRTIRAPPFPSGLNARSFHPRRFLDLDRIVPAQLSRSILERTPCERTVRLAFTTRDRTPRRTGAEEEEPGPEEGEAGSKVTTPPDWAPCSRRGTMIK